MNILLTNDDGVYADGLWALDREMRRDHRVWVVAPDRERSAIGHGITLHQPLRARKVELNENQQGHSVNGTPADCIKLALAQILPWRPDMVISGINPGANVGINVNYSGTVAAAKEGALAGLPAIAVSIAALEPQYYGEAAAFIARLVPVLKYHQLSYGTFLNVNLPDRSPEDIAGIRISRQTIQVSGNGFEKRRDPRQRAYYWQGCDLPAADNNPELDGSALRENYISITPIKCDMTDYDAMEHLKQWEIPIT